ncbi:MAG TPA: alanine racemase, partial [Tepidisphaeraceae bacterium]
EYLQQHVRPAVSNVEQARALRAASPVVCVDTGMQRFACPAEHVAAVCEAGGCGEVFTHATKLAQVEQLLEITRGMNVRRHASGSAQLGYAEAQLDAVRPGFALYRDAIRVTAPLVEARQTRGPAGYSGFSAARHGVIIAGYSNGLRVGPCLINGMPRRILEVGMQSSYVELGDTDSVGDQVVLLGDGLSEAQVAKAWGTSPHEALLRLASMGTRQYSPPEPIA